jgi:hypothetical protein
MRGRRSGEGIKPGNAVPTATATGKTTSFDPPASRRACVVVTERNGGLPLPSPNASFLGSIHAFVDEHQSPQQVRQ